MNDKVKTKNNKLSTDNCSTNRNFEQLFKKSKISNVKTNKNKLFDEILIKSSENNKTSIFPAFKIGQTNVDLLKNAQISIKKIIVLYFGLTNTTKSQTNYDKLLSYNIDKILNITFFCCKITLIMIYCFVFIINNILIFFSKNYIRLFSKESDNIFKSFNFNNLSESTNITSSSNSLALIKQNNNFCKNIKLSTSATLIIPDKNNYLLDSSKIDNLSNSINSQNIVNSHNLTDSKSNKSNIIPDFYNALSKSLLSESSSKSILSKLILSKSLSESIIIPSKKSKKSQKQSQKRNQKQSQKQSQKRGQN